MSKRKILSILVLALVLLSLIACHGKNASLTLSETDAGKTLTLKPGDTLVVALDGNLTTGYTWEPQSLDSAVLKQIGEPQMKPDSKAIGAGGKISLAFQAIQSGQVSLKLVYHRSWEKDVPPLKTYEVMVVVQ